jgi:hypothetical protein
VEIITILLSVYKFGRALLNGGSLDTAAGDLLAAFLRPLLAGQDETIRALDRIEATLGTHRNTAIPPGPQRGLGMPA